MLKAYTEEAQEEEDDELNMDEDDEEDYSIKDQDGGKTSSLVPSKITVGRGSGERQELFVPEFYPGVDGVSSVAEMIFRHGDNKDAIESLREDDEEEEVVVNNLIAKVLARVVKRAGLEGLADDRDVATKTVKIKGKEGPMFLRLTALQKGDPVEWAKERVSFALLYLSLPPSLPSSPPLSFSPFISLFLILCRSPRHTFSRRALDSNESDAKLKRIKCRKLPRL